MGDGKITRDFHKWYYESEIWDRTSFLGVRCLKLPFDLWNYQEIIVERRPSIILEMGAYYGGSTLFFSTILAEVNPFGRVVTVDINPDRIDDKCRSRDNIEIVRGSSLDKSVSEKLHEMRDEFPGPLFAILDSLHTMDHVLSEMENLRSLLKSGDYLILEDTNMNGNPVVSDWGPGPMEALLEYENRFPMDYVHDTQREKKFGFTFAPRGYLIRR